MKRNTYRAGSVSLVLALAMLVFACGGGGGSAPGGGMMPLTASFAGMNQNPGANTLSMAAGAAAGANFSIVVRVTDIAQFYGGAFYLTFDQATAQFVSLSSTGSVLLGQGATTDFDARIIGPGTLSVVATLQQQVAGVNVAGTQPLVTLNFRATTATAGNQFTFGAAQDREVQTCPAPPGACTIVPDGNLTWSGGTMTATN